MKSKAIISITKRKIISNFYARNCSQGMLWSIHIMNRLFVVKQCLRSPTCISYITSNKPKYVFNVISDEMNRKWEAKQEYIFSKTIEKIILLAFEFHITRTQPLAITWNCDCYFVIKEQGTKAVKCEQRSKRKDFYQLIWNARVTQQNFDILIVNKITKPL